MAFRAAIHLALQALARNKLRTVLTMLGITIGIGAVICTVAIGEGGSSLVHDQLVALGANMVWIEAGGRNINGVRTGNAGTKTLTLEDADAIARAIPFISVVAPNVDGNVQVVYGNLNWYTRYRGVSPEYFRVRRWDLQSGSLFTQGDVDRLSTVCLLGQTLVEKMFREDDPVGKTIRVQDLPCKVLGVLQRKGVSGTGFDQDDIVVMPITTAMHKLKGISWVDDIYCSATAPETVVLAEDQIYRLMRQRHRIRPDEPDDFNIRHPQDALKAQEEASKTLTLMLASLASVSLLVGGIGIMNIMLVSVTERTREIGVRMAVGAAEEDVRLQFLIEALALSLFGGAIGVVVGMGASFGVTKILQWPAIISPLAVVVAAVFSVLVGLFFGYYPAQKAASLDPIEALRYE
jgi:putative ABC transport system permease protein